MNFEIKEEQGRLDAVLSDLTGVSRSKIQKQIKEKKVTVNGKTATASYIVKPNDEIVIPPFENEREELKPYDLSLDIVFENENLMVINKPSGLVVHPAPGHHQDTLVNALFSKTNLSHQDSFRPGVVHRLDKDTSGLMLIAKNDIAHEKLSEMLKSKEIERHYLAVVDGVIPNETGTIDAPIGRDPKNRLKMKVEKENSKEAITHFKVLKRYTHHTLIECVLETGRTHQIRMHMDYIGYPITNDPLYGHHKKTTPFGQLLHSKSLRFKEPITGEELFFECDPPEEFFQILTSCENKENEV